MSIPPIKKTNNLENASLYFKLKKVLFIQNNKNIGNDD
ncbi:hypothetical protein K151_793 [Proteus hauseri ZMd44]|nr:hypothetical protein K151_793 [Proteus hauseri ZMd44]